MIASPHTVTLASEVETASFASALGAVLQVGDTVLLSGDVGAGKSFLARGLIKSLIGSSEDVPSPTFTLVQTYETAEAEIWHCDLYRLTDLSEIEELGLIAAFETAICLVEWPDRLGPYAPSSALSISLSEGPTDESRTMVLSWSDPRWAEKGFMQ